MLNLSPQYAGCHDIPAFAGFSAPCSFNMRAFAFRIPARWGVGRKRRKISKGSDFKPSHCLPVNGRARSVVLLVSLRLRAGGRLAGLAPSSQRGVMKCGLALLYHRFSMHVLLHNAEESRPLCPRICHIGGTIGALRWRRRMPPVFLATLHGDRVSFTAPACWSLYGNDDPSRFYTDSA